MADEDLELEAQEGEDSDGEKPAGKTSGGKTKLIAIVAVVALGAGGYYFYSSQGADPEMAETSDESDEEVAAPKNARILESGGVYKLDPLLVNLADSEKNRFLRAEIQLVFATTDGRDLVKESEVAKATIQHAMLNLLSGKHSSEIDTPEKRVDLREEIAQMLKEALQGIKIADVLLTDFIIQ